MACSTVRKGRKGRSIIVGKSTHKCFENTLQEGPCGCKQGESQRSAHSMQVPNLTPKAKPKQLLRRTNRHQAAVMAARMHEAATGTGSQQHPGWPNPLPIWLACHQLRCTVVLPHTVAAKGKPANKAAVYAPPCPSETWSTSSFKCTMLDRPKEHHSRATNKPCVPGLLFLPPQKRSPPCACMHDTSVAPAG